MVDKLQMKHSNSTRLKEKLTFIPTKTECKKQSESIDSDNFFTTRDPPACATGKGNCISTGKRGVTHSLRPTRTDRRLNDVPLKVLKIKPKSNL